MTGPDLQGVAVRLADVALALQCLSDPPRALGRTDMAAACGAAAVAVDRVIEDLSEATKGGQ